MRYIFAFVLFTSFPLLSAADVESTTTTVQSSDNIQAAIEEYSPSTASTLGPAFEFIDHLRDKGAKILDSQIDWAKKKIDKKPPGIVAGEQTGGGSWMDTVFFAIYTLYFYLLTVIRYILANPVLFYPVAVILFFLVLWKTFKRIRRRY